MKRAIRGGLLAGLLAVGTAVAAQACDRERVVGGDTLIDPMNINQALLDRTIQSELNYTRCRKGLPRVNYEPRLQPVAQRHSDWMAKNQKVTHKAGLRSLRMRLNKAGVRYKVGAENIVKTALYRIEQPRGYLVVDTNRCQFTTVDGKPIPRHTYNTLANYAVMLWMQSPGHRQHIEDPRLKIAATAASYDPKARHCGALYVTQNFLG